MTELDEVAFKSTHFQALLVIGLSVQKESRL
jgi:hypothetical protein